MVFVLDAMLDSLVAIVTSPAGAALMRCADHVLGLRPQSPTGLARCGRALETLAPLLSHSTPLAGAVTEAFFGMIEAMHNVRGAVPIANSEHAPFVREQRQLTKCYFTIASRAPQALAPMLDTCAGRTQQLATAGVIGDADRNTIFEGLAAVAARCDADLFGRVFAALTSQVRDFWVEVAGTVQTVASFVSQMLSPVQQGPDGAARIGGAELRVRVFYSLQLLSFCSREAKNVAAGRGKEVRVQLCTCDYLPPVLCTMSAS